MTPIRLPRIALPIALSAALAAAVVGAPAVSGAPASAADETAFPVQLVRVDTPRAADKSRLTNLGLDLTEHAGAGFVEVVLHTAADAARLRDAGLTYDVRDPGPGAAHRTEQQDQQGVRRLRPDLTTAERARQLPLPWRLQPRPGRAGCHQA